MSQILTKDYHYSLPQERIALHPLPERDHSKLLIFRDNKIEHSVFSKISEHLPENSFLFFNNTRVIPARLLFKKETGAEIEIFLLTPEKPSVVLTEVMTSKENCIWQCAIGNLKKWNEGVVLEHSSAGSRLKARLIDRIQGTVEFTWSSEMSFAEVIQHAGKTPLPPYLKREAIDEDKERYQTIYSHFEGAVAAPTAGLHFTKRVFAQLEERRIDHDFLTLHVSAGTFQPIKTEDANEHNMHEEQIIVTKQNIKNLLADSRFTIPVGTTSMRTLESIFWYGVKLISDPASGFCIGQNDPYVDQIIITKRAALESVLNKMNIDGVDYLIGKTSIFIKPGYQFRICDALITNFHQPGSTLILLVAACIGPAWRKVYDEALENNYRFLSYGDSSLLFIKK